MSTYTRADFAAEPDVSRETLELFEAWRRRLETWNARINLVSAGTLSDFWERHALDSWQLATAIPDGARTAIDLGSGAGFPGLAVAMAFKQRGEGRVLLVESAGKKANFLRTVARELDLPADVSAERAESLPRTPYDLVTARAFAPLPRLLAYAEPFWGPDTLGLFLKGSSVDTEIAEAAGTFGFSTETRPSRSSETGKLLAIRELVRLESTGQVAVPGRT